MTRVVLVASLALALASGTAATAQELNLAATSTERPSILALRTGLDHALVGEIGYLRVLAVGDRQLFVGGAAAMPWAEPDLADHRIQATVGMPFGGKRWKLAGWLSPTLHGTENAASDMAAVGVDGRLTGGYYARRWFTAAEAGYDWIAATHITFSDAYRSRAYSGARDGWYRTPGGTAYAGLQGGVSFSSFDVVLRAGLPRSADLGPQTVPLYVTLGVNWALSR
jgi:hypothetical protein